MPRNYHLQQHIGTRQRNKRREKWNRPSPRTTAPNLATVEVVSIKRLRPGVVVWAHIPYAEGSDEKTRPAVVVSANGRTIELLPIGSSLARFRYAQRYVEIQDLEPTGLNRPCGVRLSPVHVDRIEIVGVVGSLSDADHEAVLDRVPSKLAS